MITLEKAKAALQASEKKANELSIAVSTIIVDDHGTIIAASKMDGAINISPRFAHAKASTSANLGMPTEAIGPYAGEGKPYFGVNTVLNGELTPVPGGIPVTMHGKLAGAVGVGGSQDVSQDVSCAQEAVKALSE